MAVNTAITALTVRFLFKNLIIQVVIVNANRILFLIIHIDLF